MRSGEGGIDEEGLGCVPTPPSAGSLALFAIDKPSKSRRQKESFAKSTSTVANALPVGAGVGTTLRSFPAVRAEGGKKGRAGVVAWVWSMKP